MKTKEVGVVVAVVVVVAIVVVVDDDAGGLWHAAAMGIIPKLRLLFMILQGICVCGLFVWITSVCLRLCVYMCECV